MTQEEKQLLLKDLSARLPYGVKIHHGIPTLLISIKSDRDGMKIITEGSYGEHIFDIEDMKPYLRQLSSMTEEEKEQLAIIRSEDFQLIRQWVKNESIEETGAPCPVTCGEIDYCNKKHLDYRGLIEKGLSLEASEGMYNIKEK